MELGNKVDYIGYYLLKKPSVIAQRRNNFEQWKDSMVSYGQRWIAKIVFSSLKRMFGEYVYSIKMENRKQELLLKASLYSNFMYI